MDLEIKFGWVCPICNGVYDNLVAAEACLNDHVEYNIEKAMTLSNPWPINIRVWKEVAGKRVEWKDYNPEPTTHKVRK